MTIAHLDIETFSACDLKKCGVYKYAEDSSTELLVACYSFDDGPVTIWVPTDILPSKMATLIAQKRRPGTTLLVQKMVPADLREHVAAGKPVHAYNAAFERVVLNGEAGRKTGFPLLSITQMRCTAVKSRSAGMPDSLGDACVAMGTHPKDSSAHLTMLQLSKPRKPSKENAEPFYSRERYPEKHAELCLYCVDDVLAEADLDEALPAVQPDEWEYWFMDQRMNDRGVYANLKSVADFQFLIEEYKKEIAELVFKHTKCKPTQREQIANWIRANGWPALTDLQADTVKKLVLNKDVPEKVKVILRAYSTYGMKAVSKFTTIQNAVCKDGRLRGLFVFYGASTTGRWSSKIVQLQNLYRSQIDDCDVAIDAVAERDLQWIKALFDVDPMKVFASCIRGVLQAKPGARLFGIDYSGIESRYVAWLFGEQWKLKVFRDYDAKVGFDNYTTTYASIFNMNPKDVTKKQRQIGKPIELSLAYEGGFNAFVTMAANYNVDLKELADSVWGSLDPEALDSAEWMWDKYGKSMGADKKIYLACEAIKWLWRERHPKIKGGWKQLKEAAIAAVDSPGQTFTIPTQKIMFRVVDRWLVVRLPSGRKLRYFEPRVTGSDRDRVLSYMGVDTDTRRWMRTTTYGGKWCENICQAGSSDFIRYGSLQLEKEGFKPVMTIHDEIVLECDEGWEDFETAKKIYTRKQDWAKDFPLAAEGFEALRFRK